MTGFKQHPFAPALVEALSFLAEYGTRQSFDPAQACAVATQVQSRGRRTEQSGMCQRRKMSPPPSPMTFIILGAGGAGLMAAATAAQGGARVLVLDHNAEPGRKILISGGGRCNFTNVHTAPDRYLSANPALRQVRAQPLHARRFCCSWSKRTALPGMKRRWDSFSAMALPGRFWTCCWPNAPRAA
jgi:hypothetical protein